MVLANVDHWTKKATGLGVSTELIDRYIADLSGVESSEALKNLARQTGVQLVLHGHQHAGDSSHWANGYCQVLSAGSLCLGSGELPQDEPLSCKLIELEKGVNETKVWSFVYAPRDRAPGRVEQGLFRLDTAEPQPRQLPIKAPKTNAAPRGRKPALGAEQEHFLFAYRRAFEVDFDRWDLCFQRYFIGPFP